MKKILLVDDDVTMHVLLEDYFSDKGRELNFCILPYTDPLKALDDMLKENELPILIFLDWMMPILNGLEFLKRIKGYDHLRSIPVVMLTARGMDFEVKQAYEEGATNYLIKPCDFNDMWLEIQKYL